MISIAQKFESFANPNFVKFSLGQTAAVLANQMIGVAIGWQIYDITRDPFILGMVGLMQFLPQLLLTLVVGHVVDRYNRKRLAILCFCLEGSIGALLAASCFFNFASRDLVLCGAFIIGAARAFSMPTMQSMLPGLVELGELPRCLALNATARQTGFLLGPALGGLIYAAGAGVVYSTCAASMLLAIFLFMSLRVQKTVAPRESATLSSVFEGIRFIRQKPEILGAISLDLFSVLLGGATALLPVYARDILQTGPFGLGLLRTAPAAGAILMSLYLGRFPLNRAVGKKMFAAVAGFGLATIIFGVSRSFWLSLASLAALGVCDMVSVVVRHSLVQLETPDDKRGRVSAVNSVFIGTSNQLGEFESGVTAAWFGAVPAVVLGGVCTLLVVGLWMKFFPQLVNRDKLVPEAEKA